LPWVVVIVVAWLFSSLFSGGTSASPAAAPPPPPPQEAPCYSSETYDGNGTCRQGGEIVSVRNVVDGDTLELVDGRTVRLLGVDAPLANKCAGPGALAFTRGKTEGKKVKLHSEPGTDTDESGNLWRYVAYSESNDSRTNLPIFSEDLGHDLVLAGWAKPKSGGENAEYMSNLVSAADIAAYQPEGMYASPCGKPKVYGDDDGNGVADYEEDLDGNVNAPNVNLPDGALTGGFCARKRWC
jgi:endonuclease YncB( thermonuclease family)